MNQKIKLVVVNENTLGYILPEFPKQVSVLHASILKGAYQGSIGNPIPIGEKWCNHNVRLANAKDFDDYRVSFEGYKNHPQEYEFQE
jgi:hypothetical protein